MDDGGEYLASAAQQWLWADWAAFWLRVGRVRDEHRAKLITVFNGDVIDGAHHATTQILSGNPNAQAAVLNACLSIPLAMKPDNIAIIRGTEAHTGQSAAGEERIADGLKRDKRPVILDADTGTASHWHLRMEIDHVLIDVTHHGRTGQREHTRGSQAVLHAHDILLAHAKNGERPPDLCLRGHHHKFNDSHDSCPVRVVTTGAWQLATGYVHKVAPDSLSDIGGVIVVIKDGAYTVEKVQFHAERSTIWKA